MAENERRHCDENQEKMRMDTEFEEKLMDLISEYQKKGLANDQIASVLELRMMAIQEEASDAE